jgi:hypothetical protein
VILTTVVNIRSGVPFDVYIGRYNRSRGLQQSVWANPFKIGPDGDRTRVIEKYREYILGRPDLLARIGELRGKVLACWCYPDDCHGDVLAELAHDHKIERLGDPEQGQAGGDR